MSFANYTELQAEVLSWLARPDLASKVPSWIAVVEAQISRELRRTTVRQSISVNSDSVALPAAVAELRSLRLVTADPSRDMPIKIVTPEMLAERRAARNSNGRPIYASVLGSTLLLVPACDQVYTMEITYFPRLVPLSDSVPTNIVLTEAPDLYLFGALKEAAPFLEDDNRVALWESKYETALTQLNKVRGSEEFNASLRPARLPRVF